MHVLEAAGTLGPTLDAAAVRRWGRLAVDRLAAYRDEIDALNVFPVADSDTGSNLLSTLRAAESALTTVDTTSTGAALSALATGAARGAVGNSGFIVSQLLRGLAEAADEGPLDAAALAAGLVAGAELARAAVVSPVEGTVLTVARHAADAAARAVDTAGTSATSGTAALPDVARAAAGAAAEALARTTDQLPELARHGVVDAGGRGLVVLLDALVAVATGDTTAPPPAPAPVAPRRGVARESGSPEFGFEVQYLLEDGAGTGTGVEGLGATLDALGDSVAIVPVTAGSWKVHVHVNDVGAAIEAGLAAGRVHGIEVVSFAEQQQAAPPAREQGTAVVAVAPGAGLAHLFEAEGVHALDAPGGGSPPADDVLAAIRATGADEIVLLPNAAVATGAAEDAARRARRDGIRVAVVPTRSPVQGLAAIAVHDAARPFDDDVVAMAEAAAATRVAELTVAAEQALTAVGMCQPGDVLGLIDGEVVEIGRGMLAVAFGLVDRLLGVGAELMTVVVGDGAPRRAGELVEAHIRGRAPFTDVTVYTGDQPDHPVIIGAE